MKGDVTNVGIYKGENEFERLIDDLDYTLSMVTEPITLNEIELATVQKLMLAHKEHLSEVEDLESEVEDLESEIAAIENDKEHSDWEIQENMEHYKELAELKDSEVKELKKERATLRGKITRLEKKLNI